MFCKKDVLRNFAKFRGKHLCLPATLLKKKLCHRCFPVNFAKFLRTSVLTEHLWWLLLYSEPCRTFMIEFFAKAAKTIFTKCSIYMFDKGLEIRLLIPMRNCLCYQLFHDGDPYHIEASSLIFRANQWMVSIWVTSLVKELNEFIRNNKKTNFTNIINSPRMFSQEFSEN